MRKDTSFGGKIRQWRKSNNLLQKEAAELLKVPLDTYRAWEYNNCKPSSTPNMSEIERRMEAVK